MNCNTTLMNTYNCREYKPSSISVGADPFCAAIF